MMNKSKSTLMFCLLAGVSVAICGQDRKEVRDRGIVSKTVQEYFIEEGLDEPLIESIEKYNKDGDVIEIEEFNKRGEVTLWEKYSYDDDRNMIEKVYLNPKGKVVRTEKFIFKDGLRVEKHYLNNRNKLYKKKVYLYEYRQQN